ncbi:hypothetical protein JNJ66_04025 [Candidatus Saccharibacteria bacterium]|nr:hypothetical protein [Candidatus Saccharibacteria bacterium]
MASKPKARKIQGPMRSQLEKVAAQARRRPLDLMALIASVDKAQGQIGSDRKLLLDLLPDDDSTIDAATIVGLIGTFEAIVRFAGDPNARDELLDRCGRAAETLGGWDSLLAVVPASAQLAVRSVRPRPRQAGHARPRDRRHHRHSA